MQEWLRSRRISGRCRVAIARHSNISTQATFPGGDCSTRSYGDSTHQEIARPEDDRGEKTQTALAVWLPILRKQAPRSDSQVARQENSRPAVGSARDGSRGSEDLSGGSLPTGDGTVNRPVVTRRIGRLACEEQRSFERGAQLARGACAAHEDVTVGASGEGI